MPPTRRLAVVPRRPADEIADLVGSFMNALEAQHTSERTRQSYSEAVLQLLVFLQATGRPTNATAVTRADVTAFEIDLRDKGRSPATVANRHRSLVQFFRYLVEEQLVTTSPMAGMRHPRTPETMPHVVSVEQMRAILRTCEGPSFDDRRDTAVLSLMFDTGIRLGEAAGIQLRDLDITARNVAVTGKTGDRICRFSSGTRRVIERWLRERANHRDAETGWLWLGQRGRLSTTGIEQMVKRRAAAVGMDLSPHAFRHGWTDAMLRSGANPGDVMRLGGWRSRDMIERVYARTTAAERARANFDQHAPMDKVRGR